MKTRLSLLALLPLLAAPGPARAHDCNGAWIGLGLFGAAVGVSVVADALSRPPVYYAPAPAYIPPTYPPLRAYYEPNSNGYADGYEAGRRAGRAEIGDGPYYGPPTRP